MDGEFEKIKDVLPTVECNTTAAKEHVSEAERTIRTVKERTRGLVCTLPFMHIPRQMKIKFVYFMVLWLNAFPVKTGISGVYSPQNCWCNGASTKTSTAEFCQERTVRCTTSQYLQTQ